MATVDNPLDIGAWDDICILARRIEDASRLGETVAEQIKAEKTS